MTHTDTQRRPRIREFGERSDATRIKWYVYDETHCKYLRRNGEWKAGIGPPAGPDSGCYHTEAEAQAALDRWRESQIDAAADDMSDFAMRCAKACIEAGITEPEGLGEFVVAASDLHAAQADYRNFYNRFGGDSLHAGRAWDVLRRCDKRFADALASLRKAGGK